MRVASVRPSGGALADHHGGASDGGQIDSSSPGNRRLAGGGGGIGANRQRDSDKTLDDYKTWPVLK